MEETEPYAIERFDPLLRDLLTWGLVTRDPTEPGSPWRLAETAQRRLDALPTPAERVVPPENLIYFDHACHQCHRHGPTRLNGGTYLCDECRLQRATQPAAAVPEETQASRRGHRRRDRLEENPLAS